MNKESLMKARELLIQIYTLDIPLEDKNELVGNLDKLLNPENYSRHIKVLQREFNEELKWKNK